MAKRTGTTVWEFEHPEGRGRPVRLEILNTQMELALSRPRARAKKADAQQAQSFIALRYNMRVQPKPKFAVTFAWLRQHMTSLGSARVLKQAAA